MLLDRLEAYANSLGKCHYINNYTILVANYLWYNIEIVKKNARAYYVNLDVIQVASIMQVVSCKELLVEVYNS
jgi:hypothetical protein